MITRLAHVCVLARDLEETERFYCEKLGLGIAFEFQKNGERFGYYLGVGETTFIEVFRGDPENSMTGMRHFCLEVPDIDVIRDRLEGAGVVCTEKKLARDESWQFWFKDPNGYDIEVMQYTPASMQLRGGIAHL